MKNPNSILIAACLLMFSISAVAAPDAAPARPKFHPRFSFLAKVGELSEVQRIEISDALYRVDDQLAKMKAHGGFYLSARELSPENSRFRNGGNGAMFEGFYKLESAPLFVRALTAIPDDVERRAAFGVATKSFSELLINYMEAYRLDPAWSAMETDFRDKNFLLRHGQERAESSYKFSMETNAFKFLRYFNGALIDVGAISAAVNLVEYWTAVADSKNMKFSPLASIAVAEMRKSILEHSIKNGLDVRSIRVGVAALKQLDLPLRAVQGWQFGAGAESDAMAETSRNVWEGTTVARLIALRLEIVSSLEQAKKQLEQGSHQMTAKDRAEAVRIFAREYTLSSSERRLVGDGRTVENSKIGLALRSISVRICREMFQPTF